MLGKKTRTGGATVHDVLVPVARLLRSQDFAIGIDRSPTDEPRLVARRVRDVVVVDVCRPSGGGGRARALAALGPMMLARWQLEREVFDDARLQAMLWLAFSARPPEEIAVFLEESGVLVSVLQRAGVVELTDRSKQRWYQALGVR